MQQLLKTKFPERQLSGGQFPEKQLSGGQFPERQLPETAEFWLERIDPEKRGVVLASEEEIRALNSAAFAEPRCEMHDILAEASAHDGGEGAELNTSARADGEGAALGTSARADGEGAALGTSARDKGEAFVRGIAYRRVSVLFRPEEPAKDADEAYLTEIEAGEPFLAFRFSADRNYLKVRTTCTEGWIRAGDVKLFGSEKTWRTEARDGWEARKLPRPLTPENLLEELFRNYGAGYRFGSRTDCTGYIRTVFERFGLLLPSNSVKQVFYPARKYDLAGLSDAEKVEIIKGLPLGAVLYMPMHAVVWLGEVRNDSGSADSAYAKTGNPIKSDAAGNGAIVNDAGGIASSLYVINAVGSCYDAEGSLHRPRRIMVNSLDLRRKSGETWLSSLTAALVPWEGA